jgi:predicted nucleic acid-binding protein
MKHTFVLDENVFVFAIKMRDERGRVYDAPARLIESIAKNCHKIVVNTELYRRYCRHADHIPKEVVASKAMRVIFHMLQNASKSIWNECTQECNFEGTIPQDDRPIARLAACTGAILVTKDKDFEVAAARLKVVSPEKAIEYAMVSDPRS